MYYVKQLLNEDNSIYYRDLKESLQGDYNIITYRKHYDCINGDIINFIYDSVIDYSIYEIESCYKNNVAAYLCDTLKRYAHISLKDAIKLSQLLKDNGSTYDEIVCATLSALFKKRYEITILKGYCQDDWIKCYYAIDSIQQSYMDYVESVLFNTGVEVMIHDSDNTPESADDIDGYCDYIPLNHCDLLDDVADWLCTDKSNIKLYEIEKTYTVTKVIYKEVL